MAAPEHPGDIPPDLPPEYADAYRLGYRRAYELATGESSGDSPSTAGERTEILAESARPGGSDAWALSATGDRSWSETGTGDREPDRDRPRRLLAPLLLVGLALLLVVTAYGLGRLFAGGVEPSNEEPTTGVVTGGDAGDAGSPSAEGSPTMYTGSVEAVAIAAAEPSCQSEDGVDAAGRAVSYPGSSVYDGRKSTAWRCDGQAVGETLTIDLPEGTRIGQVGLIPGYAKTDPANGADRYAENNRITEVRWTFDDGWTTTQRLDGSPGNRRMQKLRIPVHEAQSVTLEILAVTPGPRNTTAISEILIAEPTD